MRRVVVPELLDSDSGTPQEISDSLADLRWLNRNFGGISTTTRLLHRVASQIGLKRVSFLDVAGASGDVAAGSRAELQEMGIGMEVTVLDRSASHLNSDMASVVGDAFHLPFRNNAFDVVGSALFIHHLEPEQIVEFANECLRVCAHACIINDLRRGYFHYLTAYAGRLLYKSRITTHDSVASVRRAYTRDELREILESSKAATIDFSDHYFSRMGVVLWKKGVRP
jgi:ubiquinone/menaquinone biosynthesis C-methylase UbiE